MFKQWTNLLDYINENPRYFDLTHNNISNSFNYPKVAQKFRPQARPPPRVKTFLNLLTTLKQPAQLTNHHHHYSTGICISHFRTPEMAPLVHGVSNVLTAYGPNINPVDAILPN